MDLTEFKQRLAHWKGEIKMAGGHIFKVEANPRDPVDVARAQDMLMKMAAMLASGAAAPATPLRGGIGAPPTPAGAPTGVWPPAPIITASAPIPLSLNECRTRWAAVEGRTWDAKTAFEYKRVVDEFLARLKRRGVTALAQAHKGDVGDYKAYLAGERELAPKTINKKLSAIASLFRWGESNEQWLDGKPLPTSRQFYTKAQLAKTSETWLAFTAEQLKIVFEPTRWRAQKTAHEFWVALLCLHLALRASEASQLATNDFFKSDDDVWCVSINEEGEGSDLKTEASKRTVPLPAALLELNILDYVKDVRQVLGGEGRLFPYLPVNELNGFGSIPGKQFGRYLDKWLPDHGHRSMHSLRKTPNVLLQNANIALDNRHQFLGQKTDSVNAESYSEVLTAGRLHGMVGSLLRFPIDYAALAYRRGEFLRVLHRDIRCWERKRREAR